MEGFGEFIVYLVQLIAPQPCFDEIFIKHNFLDGTYYAFSHITTMYLIIVVVHRTCFPDCITALRSSA